MIHATVRQELLNEYLNLVNTLIEKTTKKAALIIHLTKEGISQQSLYCMSNGKIRKI